MRVAVVGGGPGGLLLAALAGRDGADVTVFERNRADDAFGFGVVFSDATLANIDAADPVLRRALTEHGVHWDAIEVRLKGERLRVGGNGMASVVRRTLLRLLQQDAAAAGAELRFSTEVSLDDLAGFDVVVAADGAASRVREQLADQLRPSYDEASAKFIWFGAPRSFDCLTFVHERSEHGVFAVHGYPISADVDTFIVETDEASWRAAGLDGFDTGQPPGPSDEASRRYLEQLFDTPLLVNSSRWSSFRTRRAATWRAGNVVLLGDAAHTAHFSVGSGTKMAMEDAIALARCLREQPDVDAALGAYEAAARPSVERIQGSAGPSLAWWEHFGRSYDALEPWQFAFHFLSRSMDLDRMRRRQPEFVDSTLRRWQQAHGAEPLASALPGLGLARRALVLDGEQVRPPDGPPLDVLRLTAPPAGGELAGLVRQARADAGGRLVLVDGPTPLAATLLCEALRLEAGLPVALAAPGATRSTAVTALLSGRADLVAALPADLAGWDRPPPADPPQDPPPDPEVVLDGATAR